MNRSLFPAVFLLVAGTACATNLDMTSIKGRMDTMQGRIDILEKAVAKSAGQSVVLSQQGAVRAGGMEQEVGDLRKGYADQQATLQDISGKLESALARLAEVERGLAQQQKKGIAADKSLESLAVKLEAEARSLGEKIKELVSPK